LTSDIDARKFYLINQTPPHQEEHPMSTVDKLAKILNLAENASTPEEADAYMQKAQALATTASIDLAVARQYTAKKEKREQPTHKTITIGEARKNNNARFVELFNAIASANDVQINMAMNSTYVIAFGMPSDIEVVEVLYTSLLFQMVESANAWLKKGEYKEERVWSDRTYTYRPMSGKTARANFYDAFVQRINLRLWEARRQALAAVQEQSFTVLDQESGQEVQTSAALVLKTKAVEVNDYYKATSRARGSWKGASVSHTSSAARSAGDSAGRSARLGSQRAIGGHRTGIAA
jgi:hypothetical protein